MEKDYDPAQLVKYQQLGVRELVRYDPEFYLHPRALKFGPRRLLTHWARTEAGLLVEQPLASKRSADREAAARRAETEARLRAEAEVERLRAELEHMKK